ncbi:MAG: hypothetical protein HPY75_05055 [Actinobacteria bacterium]|nr:hypothetical protein [Actinomycetota bacterium]
MSMLYGDRTFLDGNGACDSIIRIELITHFHRNPGMEGTPERMADAIGRERKRVEAQLKKLVQLRILEERVKEGVKTYRYLPPVSISSRRCVEGKAPDTENAVVGAT